MFGFKFIDIADNERGLLFRKNSFQRVLEPGHYRFYDFLGALHTEIYDTTQTEFKHKLGRFLVTTYADKVKRFIDAVDIKDHEVGLVYQEGKLVDIIKPGSFRLYWKVAVSTEVKVIDISENYTIDSALLAVIARNKDSNVYKAGIKAVFYIEVPDSHVGLLLVNGKLEKQLKPGSYGYWRFNRNIEVKRLDCRLQNMEVSGQEILTKDRVSLRINLSASYRIVDTEKAVTLLGNFTDFLYRELQLALRETVGTRSLDDLLADKSALNGELESAIKLRALEYGLQVQDIGVKDIILPGDMKAILNKVVEAQKTAEANLIRRREETQAMRSLHNTAKMMENNPVLMRLKELEALEQVTQHIDKITVYGGLDGVLNELVTLRPN